MKQNIYTVLDQKAGAYLAPFFMLNDGMAVRTIENCLFDKDHQFFRHPEDYLLYKIGEYDDLQGLIYGTNEPQLVSKVIDLHLSAMERQRRQVDLLETKDNETHALGDEPQLQPSPPRQHSTQ